MSLSSRLARLEDAYAVGVDYDAWPVGEQMLDAIAPIRARLREGVRGKYRATDREITLLVLMTRYADECKAAEREESGGEAIEYVLQNLPKMAEDDPEALLGDLNPHVRRPLERMPPSEQARRERVLFEYWLARGPTTEL